MTYRMADSITVANLPMGMDAYAGYVDGRWPDYQSVAAGFPASRHLAIDATNTATLNADCLDVETGDATPSQVPGFLARWKPKNTPRGVVYCSTSAVPDVLAAVAGRAGFLLWTAHYTNVPHICTSTSCWPQSPTPWTADGTQWTDHGGVWDESLCADDFFVDPQPPPIPAAPPEEDIMRILSGTGVPTMWWTGAKLVELPDVTHVAAVEAFIAGRALTTPQYTLVAALLNG